MATLAELRGLLRLQLNDNAAEGYLWGDATLDLQINSAIREYGRGFPMQRETTVTTVAGQREYDLPADCLSVLRVAGGSCVASGLVPDGSRYAGSPSEGYELYGGKLILYLAPAESGLELAVRYLAPHTPLSSDGDSCTVPEADEDLLLAMAAARAIESLWTEEAKRRQFERRTGEPAMVAASLYRQRCESGMKARAARVRSGRLAIG